MLSFGKFSSCKFCWLFQKFQMFHATNISQSRIYAIQFFTLIIDNAHD